jgi:hypothetical protein
VLCCLVLQKRDRSPGLEAAAGEASTEKKKKKKKDKSDE